MLDTDTKSIQNAPGAVSSPTSWRANVDLWKIQSYGLVIITFLSFFPRFFHVREYLFFLLLAGALYLSRVDKVSLWPRTRIDVPLLGFVGWVLCTVPFAFDPAYSFSEWRKLVVQVILFYWAMFVLRGDRRGRTSREVLWAVVLGSLVLSGVALIDFAWRGGTWRDRLIRAEAPYSDYNWLTTYLVLVIPVLIWWILTHRSSLARTVGVVSLFLAGIAQFAAYTRAGWLAHFIQAFGFGVMMKRFRLVVWILALGVVMGGGLLAVSRIGYQRDTIDPWTLNARVSTWQLGLRQIIEHPIVGVGYGNYTFAKVHAVEVEGEKDKGASTKVLGGLHNTFAVVLMGSGVPALILFIWALGRTISELAGGFRPVQLKRSGILVLGPFVALAVIGFIARNAFDYMFVGGLASLFWILVAVGFSANEDHRRNETRRKSIMSDQASLSPANGKEPIECC